MYQFEEIAERFVIYKIRNSWLQIAKLYNDLASEHEASLGMAFALIAIDPEKGTPVTQIAPRMGMEPNSLSRILKALDERDLVFRKQDDRDSRKKFICLTETGKEVQELALKAVFRLERAITKDFSKEKLNAFFEVVDEIPKAIEEFKERSLG